MIEIAPIHIDKVTRLHIERIEFAAGKSNVRVRVFCEHSDLAAAMWLTFSAKGYAELPVEFRGFAPSEATLNATFGIGEAA